MTSKTVTVSVGMLMTLGLLLVGFYVLDRNVEPKESTLVPVNAEKEEVGIVEQVEPPLTETETETEVQLASLPNAEEEAAKWNATEPDFIAMYNEYKMEPSEIKKDETNSNDDFTIFSHDFSTPLRVSIQFTVDNETEEIINLKLIGYEKAGADRSAIFHAMNLFISYVDSEVNPVKAGEYLGTIPFSTDKDGVYKKEFNGKNYEFTLDLSTGLNMLEYKDGE